MCTRARSPRRPPQAERWCSDGDGERLVAGNSAAASGPTTRPTWCPIRPGLVGQRRPAVARHGGTPPGYDPRNMGPNPARGGRSAAPCRRSAWAARRPAMTAQHGGPIRQGGRSAAPCRRSAWARRRRDPRNMGAQSGQGGRSAAPRRRSAWRHAARHDPRNMGAQSGQGWSVSGALPSLGMAARRQRDVGLCRRAGDQSHLSRL